MSLISMTVMASAHAEVLRVLARTATAVQTSKKVARAPGPVAPGSGAPPDSPLVEAFKKVAAFIPSEALTLYVALNGVVAPTTASGKWVIFAVGLLMIPTLIVITSVIERRRVPGRELNLGKIAALSALGVVAFTTWAMSLPGSPFLVLMPDATRWGGGGMLALAVLLPYVSQLMGLTE